MWEELKVEFEDLYADRNMSSARKFKLSRKVYDYIEPKDKTGKPIAGSSDLDFLIRLRNFLRCYILNFVENSSYLREEEFLKFYLGEWERYKISSKTLNSVCTFVNIYFRHKSIDGISEYVLQHAVASWRVIWSKRVTDTVLKLVEKDRTGERNIGLSATLILGHIVDHYITLGSSTGVPSPKQRSLSVYEDSFENAFLAETEMFYRMESADFIRQNPVTMYMRNVEKRLLEEQIRIHYLEETTLFKVIEICEKVFIQQHLELFPLGFKNLLKENKNEDLSRMYRLLSRIPDGLEMLQYSFETHVFHHGISAIENCGEISLNDPQIYVNTILEIRRKYNTLVMTAFRRDFDFQFALDKACTQFIKYNAVTAMANPFSKSPELLAQYCDLLLKKNSKVPIFSELEDTLNQVIWFLKHMEEKDVFEKFYREMLAKRLLQRMSASKDVETSMVSKLKQVFGLDYTCQLEKMIKDITDTSESLNEKFMEHLRNSNKQLDFDFRIQVLRSGSRHNHPAAIRDATQLSGHDQQSIPFTLPQEFQQSVQKFTSFCKRGFPSTNLQWLHNMSKGELVTNCFGNRYTFQASMLQMAVLLQFNINDCSTIQKLQESTKIELDTLIEIVQTLVKSKLLTSEASMTDLQSSSVVMLNLGYKNKKLRVSIDKPLKIERKMENKRIYRNIEIDRKLLIQAAIVRVMKTRRQLHHRQLEAEILNWPLFGFKPTNAAIQQCVNILIENMHLERTKNGTYIRYIPYDGNLRTSERDGE